MKYYLSYAICVLSSFLSFKYSFFIAGFVFFLLAAVSFYKMITD